MLKRILLLTLISLLSFTSNSFASLTDGLVAYWSFDNCDATDYSGNGKNGTIYGNPQCVDGMQGKTLSFDGQDDYIDVPHPGYLAEGSVAGWLYFISVQNQLPDHGWMWFCMAENPYPDFIMDGLDFGVPSSYSPNLSFGIWDSSSGWIWADSGIPPLSSTWYHLVGTWGGGEIKIYVNGELKDSKSSTLGIPDWTHKTYIGKNAWGGYVNAIIDEVRIYNRALNEAEIQALYVARSFKLPDTGQTLCYDTSGNVISCFGTGQDGAYNIKPMSFTDNGNGTVTDNNTGLMWQKEDDGTPRTWDAAGSYCSSLGADWRLPTKKELMSIVDYSIPFPGPTINSIFTNTKQFGYWSSTTGSGDPNGAWTVYFNGGYVGGDVMSGGVYVRCVRGEKDTPSFTDNGNGTVADLRTGLVWQQGEPGYMKWPDALNYCENLELPSGSGQSDWRLPNIKEIESITDDSVHDPVNPFAIDRNIFPNAVASGYWSSTTFAVMPNYAWGVGFDYGRVGPSVKDAYVVSVRCVRGGQVPPSQACTYTYSDWGDCQPDNKQTRTVLSSSPAGCVGTPARSQSCPQGKLEVSPKSYDFGEVLVGQMPIFQGFILKNTGNAEIKISNIYLSDNTDLSLDTTGVMYPCSLNNQILPPGDLCNILVKYSPSQIRTMNSNLVIESNDPDTPIKEIPIKAVAKCHPILLFSVINNTFNLFEGITGVPDSNIDECKTTIDIDLQYKKPLLSLGFWASIDDQIDFDSSVVDLTESNIYAKYHLIAPGGHASFKAVFHKESQITFTLRLNSPKAALFTLADVIISMSPISPTVDIGQMNTFVNDISKADSIKEAYNHFKSAIDAFLNFDTKQASKEMKLADKSIKDLQKSPDDLLLLASAYSKLGITITGKELIKELTKELRQGIPLKFFELIKDVAVLKYNKFNPNVPMQITVNAD